MLSKEDVLLLNNFAVAIFYKDKENYKTFDFVTSCDYICKKKTPFFDLIKNKPIKKLPKNIEKVVALGVPTDLALFKLYYEADNETKENFYKDYFSNIESSIFTTLQFEKEELNNKLLVWKNSTLEELVFFAEEEFNLKFLPNTKKQIIINKLKKKFSKLLRDEIPYNIRRLLEIFNFKEESDLSTNDQTIVNKCKDKWYEVLCNRKNFTYKLLENENKDPETLEEINQIKNEIEESFKEYKTKVFDTPLHVCSFWPVILYPRPSFSIEIESDIPSLSGTNDLQTENEIDKSKLL